MSKMYFFIIIFISILNAEVKWNFYGSARMYTFGVMNKNTEKKTDFDLHWQLLGNRIGSRITHGPIDGRVELALGSDIGLRLIYGQWNFSEESYLMIGQGYGPVNFLSSNQNFNGSSIYSTGECYHDRKPFIELGIKKFRIALLDANSDIDIFLTDGGKSHIPYVLKNKENHSLSPTLDQTDVLMAEGNYKNNIPKMELAFALNSDKFRFKLAGGIHSFKFTSNHIIGLSSNDSITDITEYDITSGIAALDLGINPGIISIGLGVTFGINTSVYGISMDGFSKPIAQIDTLKLADTNSDTSALGTLYNSYSLALNIPAHFTFSDIFSLETGIGYLIHIHELNQIKNDNAMAAYLQLQAKLAEGLFSIIPEFGFSHLFNDVFDTNEGYTIYFGNYLVINF